MKKLLSLILAMVMLALPVLSVAEGSLGIIGGADGPTELFVSTMPSTPYEKALAAGRRVNQQVTITEFSGLDTGDPMTDAALTDLLQALGVNCSAQGDEYELDLTLSGKEVLNLGNAVNGEDAYIKSDMLGGTVVVNAQEVEPLANRILDMLVLMDAMTEEDAAAMREQIAAMMESIASAEEQTPAVPVITPETLDFSALQAIMDSVEAKVTPVENIIVPRMCDPAVAGAQVVFTNEDVISATKAVCQFLLDNPALMDYIGTMFGYPTEAEIAADWASIGELYMTFGIYKNEEEYRAAQQTFANVVSEVMAEVETMKIIDGDYVITMYVDAEDQPVYATLTLPLFIETETIVEAAEQTEVQGETKTVAITYTRQTVAQGVAHVCNIDVEGTGVTIDALVNDGSTTVTVTGVEPGFEPVKVLEASVKSTESETTPGVTCINIAATLYGGEEPAFEVVYDGEYENSDTREYVAGKLSLTAYEYRYMEESAMIPVTDSDTGEVEYVEGILTVSGGEVQPQAVPTSIILEFSTETLINGVDYTENASVSLEVMGVRMAFQSVTETTDPEPSIMAGEVVRPAELNDADFSNWFVGLVNAFNTWLSNAVISLPESALTLIIYAGMV